jgi:hypothetical protein
MQRLELHVNSLSKAHTEDKKHIQKLEKELLNCSQEIGSYPYIYKDMYLLSLFNFCG